MIPPVGKSGAGIIFNKSSTSRSGDSKIAIAALMDSVKLCGNIFVAIPTAIPDDPLINKLGILVGSTSGIDSVPS